MNSSTTQSPAPERVSLDGKPNNEGAESTVFDWEKGTLEQFDEFVVSGKDAAAQNEWLKSSPGDEKFKRINQLLDDRESGKYTPPSSTDGQKPKEAGEQGGDGGSEGGTEKPPESGTTEPGSGEKPNEDNIVEVNGLKISQDLLGTFLKNHSAEDAVKLALEAQQNGQKFIDDLKPKYNQLQDTTTNLRKQLIEAHQKITSLEQKAESAEQKTPEIQPFKIPEVESINFDDLDAYDPSSMEEFIKTVKTAKEKITELNKRIEGQPQQQPTGGGQPEGSGSGESQQQQQQKPQSESVSPEVKEQLDALATASIDREFDEIGELQRAVPALKTNVPFNDLDTQVANFQIGVGNASGNSNVLQATALYFSQTPEGEQLRTVCEARGIKPPAEFDKWADIMKFRKVRNTNIENHRKQLETATIRHPDHPYTCRF